MVPCHSFVRWASRGELCDEHLTLRACSTVAMVPNTRRVGLKRASIVQYRENTAVRKRTLMARGRVS